MYNMSVYEKQKGLTEWQEDIVEKDEEIDVRESLSTILRTLLKHKWSVIGLTVLVIVVAYFYIDSMQPVYRSTAMLLIEAHPASPVSIERIVNERRDDGYYNTQYEILRSRDLAEQVIRRLSLDTHPEFNPPKKEEKKKPLFTISWPDWLNFEWLKSESADDKQKQPQSTKVPFNRLVSTFSKRLTIEPISRSQLVRIGFEAHDPKLAAFVANAVGEVYIQRDREARLQLTVEASENLADRLRGLRETLEASEQQLQTFREDQNLLDVSGVRTLAITQLSGLNSQLIDMERRLTQSKVLYDQVTALRNVSLDRLASLPIIMEDSTFRSLKGVESGAQRDLSSLRERYGPNHVKILEAKATLEETRNHIAKHVQSIADRVIKDYEVAQANFELLNRAMERAKDEMQQINRKEYQLNVLSREVSANRELYDLFLRRIKETNISGDLQLASARVVDSALEPIYPAKPAKDKYLLLAACFGVALGVMWAFLREFFDNTIREVEDLEGKMACPVLGGLPKLDMTNNVTTSNQASLFNYEDAPDSEFAESMRTIRTGLLLSGLDSAQKMIVVTSSTPGEGKSTVAMNLAFSLSSMAKVLLVDADLRNPSLAEACGLDKSTTGLSQLASGMNEFSECIHELPENPNILLMPSGFKPPNPLELLSSMRFAGLLVQFNEQFDYVIVDSPPALPFSDAMVLSTYASDVVYVVQANSTPYRLVQQGIKKLNTVKASLAGVVLNQVNPKGQFVYRYKN
jgi:capsular exopolysaccharide synthesis family protein